MACLWTLFFFRLLYLLLKDQIVFILHVCTFHSESCFVKYLLMKGQGLLPHGFI